MKSELRTAEFFDGVKAGVPIALAYFAVGMSVGIAARIAGLNAFQGFLLSLFNLASAGEYAQLTVISAGGTYAEIILITLIVNARYLLMGCALAQWAPPKMKKIHRIFVPYTVTDEIFAASISRMGYMNPWFHYGAVAVAAPSWSIGTVMGVLVGSVLTPKLLAAFSMLLYAMFINIVVTPARKDKRIILCIAASFALGYLLSELTWTKAIPESVRIILITVVVGALMAWLFPVKNEQEAPHEE